MKLRTRFASGAAALLLSAAAVALVLLAGAILLAVVAAALLTAAGLFLAAPDESRRGLSALAGAINRFTDRFCEAVEEAGRMFMTVLGARSAEEGNGAAPATGEAGGEGAAPDAPREAANRPDPAAGLPPEGARER